MPQKIWLSGDYHLSHKNIIKYCNRPFDSVDEMNKTISKNHNRVVGKKDLFYFLGDLTLHNKRVAYMAIKNLNGKWHFIRGNHDKKTIRVIEDHVEWVDGLRVIQIDGKKITLSHFACRVWDGSHHGHYHFYAHSHGELTPFKNSLDVGIDNAYRLLGEYRPFSLEEALDFASKNETQMEDYHASRNREDLKCPTRDPRRDKAAGRKNR